MRLRTANGKTTNVLSTANPYESPEKPKSHVLARLVTFGVVLAVAALFGGRYLKRLWIIESVAVVEESRVEVGAPVAGRLAAVFVAEHEWVKPGDLVARFEDSAIEAERHAIDASLALARNRLELALRSDPAPPVSEAETAAATAQVDADDGAIRKAMMEEAAAREAVEAAAGRRRRIESLVLAKAATISEVDPAAREETAARSALASASGEVERLVAKRAGSQEIVEALQAKARGPLLEEARRRRDVEVADAKRTISEAREALRRLDVRRDQLDVHAARSGMVVAPPRKAGDVLSVGEPILVLRDPVEPWVDLWVRSDRAAIVFPGTKVDLTAKGAPPIRAVVDRFYSEVDILPPTLRNPDRPQDRYARARLRLDPGLAIGLTPGEVFQAKVIRAEH
jgi:HlyD family secretion protein